MEQTDQVSPCDARASQGRRGRVQEKDVWVWDIATLNKARLEMPHRRTVIRSTLAFYGALRCVATLNQILLLGQQGFLNRNNK